MDNLSRQIEEMGRRQEHSCSRKSQRKGPRMTLNDDLEPSLTAPPPREQRWPLFSVAAALVFLAWLVAKIWPVSELYAGSETYNLVAGGAVPWFLQWAGLSCAVLGCFRSVNMQQAAKFAVWGSFTLAAVWWSGLIWRFWGTSPVNALFDRVEIALKSAIGGANFFDETLFYVIGPILRPFQRSGPFFLQGWNFLSALLSTGLLVGLLLVVGRSYKAASRAPSVLDYVALFAAVLLLVLQPVVRPATSHLRQTWSRTRFENNVRRVVSGVNLQQWATNLLARPSPNGWETGHIVIEGVGRLAIPRTRTTALELGTNFPLALLAIDGAPPMVTIWQGATNLPGWVTLTWSNAETGRWGLHIGPTNLDPRPFLGLGQSDPWQRGVYHWPAY